MQPTGPALLEGDTDTAAWARQPVRPGLEPMLAAVAEAIPSGPGWQYEPKFDGFRAVVFAAAGRVLIQSRNLTTLNRYFPDLEDGLRAQVPSGAVLDGEVVIAGPHGLDFDALQLRLHPAASRVRRLARETPASFVAFDLLAADGRDGRGRPLAERRRDLERLLANARPPLYLSPVTRDAGKARDWFERFEGAGFDGLVAKRLADPYVPGERRMLKIKHRRTADCVVGGFRWYRDQAGKAIGSLLLGLYDDAGVLHHVGHTSSFDRAERRDLVARLERHRAGPGEDAFGRGRTPGAPSRWSSGHDTAWVSLRPELVCEVAFDHLQGARFRHGTTFLRWRPDKPPRDCTYDQIEAIPPAELSALFRPAA